MLRKQMALYSTFFHLGARIGKDIDSVIHGAIYLSQDNIIDIDYKFDWINDSPMSKALGEVYCNLLLKKRITRRALTPHNINELLNYKKLMTPSKGIQCSREEWILALAIYKYLDKESSFKDIESMQDFISGTRNKRVLGLLPEARLRTIQML